MNDWSGCRMELSVGRNHVAADLAALTREGRRNRLVVINMSLLKLGKPESGRAGDHAQRAWQEGRSMSHRMMVLGSWQGMS
jgi:hypothetical protein